MSPIVRFIGALAAALTLGFCGAASAEVPGSRCIAVLEMLAKTPPPAERPAMMAIGDSLFNGVTSLTIDAHRARHSMPAVVARGLGIVFMVPAYPQPILIDLERELQHPLLNLLQSAGPGIQVNIQWWIKDYPAVAPKMPEYFDNVAVAQADSRQMICDTSARADTWIRNNPVDLGALQLPDALGTWYYELNLRFLLNPRLGQSTVAGQPRSRLSQFDQVLVRHPHRLLINIGANDGVWLMAFDGDTPDHVDQICHFIGPTATQQTCISETVEEEMNDLVANMALVARYMPADVEHVYVDNLPPPSRTANLQPMPDATLTACDNTAEGQGGPTVYYTRYRTYVSDGPLAEVNAAQVCRMDRAVNRTNARIKQAMSKYLDAKRLTIIDMNGLLRAYDLKHHRGRGVPVVMNVAGRYPVVLDNEVIRPQTVFGNLHSGGLFGYDNMHPSFVGYSLGAGAILEAIKANEPGVTYDPSVLDAQRIVDEIEADSDGSAIKTDANTDIKLWLTDLALGFLPPTTTAGTRTRPSPDFGLAHFLTTVGRQKVVADEPPQR